MDISSVVNATQLQEIRNEAQRHEAIVGDFQAVLDKAAGGGEQDKKVLKEACASMESYMLQMMMRSMRKTSFEAKDGFFAKSPAEKMFTDMMDEEAAKSAAVNGGIGLADMMYKQLEKTLAAAQG